MGERVLRSLFSGGVRGWGGALLWKHRAERGYAEPCGGEAATQGGSWSPTSDRAILLLGVEV